MPRTTRDAFRPALAGSTRRLAAAALLGAALTACGGGAPAGSVAPAGGGGGQGSQPSEGQSEEDRTRAGGSSGSFASAGQPKAQSEVTGRQVRMTLKPTTAPKAAPMAEPMAESTTSAATEPSSSGVPAEISRVHDCMNSTGFATPTSREVTLVNGVSQPVEFTLPETPSGGDSARICYTLTIGGTSKTDEAAPASGTSPTSGPSGLSSSPTVSPTVSPSVASRTSESPSGGTS